MSDLLENGYLSVDAFQVRMVLDLLLFEYFNGNL